MDTVFRLAALTLVSLWTQFQFSGVASAYFNGNAGTDSDNSRSMAAAAAVMVPTMSNQRRSYSGGGYNEEVGICLDRFQLNADTIIRTQDSRVLGARYLNETELPSKEACFYWCCQVTGCNVAVFEEKDRGSCYLFDCGPPTDFKCKFTSHHRYTSAILDTSSSGDDKQQQQQSANGGHAAPPVSADEHITALKNLHNVPVAASITAPVPPTTPPVSEAGRRPAEVNANVASTPTTMTPALSTAEASKIGALPVVSTGIPGVRTPVCSHFQFQCRTSGECIAVYNACDGIPQCLDRSDEAEELGCLNAEGRRLAAGSSSTTTPQSSKPAVDRITSGGDKYDDGNTKTEKLQNPPEDGAAVASIGNQAPVSVASPQRSAATRLQQQQLLHHFNARPHEESHHEQKLKELSQSLKGASTGDTGGPQTSSSSQAQSAKSDYDQVPSHVDRRPLPQEDGAQEHRLNPAVAPAASGRDGTGYDAVVPGEYDQEEQRTGNGHSAPSGGSGVGYNPVSANQDRPYKSQSSYNSHSYKNEDRANFEDPSLVIPGAQSFPHKNHIPIQDGERNVGVIAPEVQKIHQSIDDPERHYADNYEPAFDKGPVEKTASRNFARERNYEGGYQSSESEYVPQPNVYPQDVREQVPNHHSMNSQTGIINSWAPNQNSYSRNGQYSETNMGSAQQTGYSEQQRNSGVPQIDDQQQPVIVPHPQDNLARPTYDKDAVSQSGYNQEEQTKFWPQQTSGQESNEGRMPSSVDNSNSNQDYRVPKLEVNHMVINKGSEQHHLGHSVHQSQIPPKTDSQQTASPKGGATATTTTAGGSKKGPSPAPAGSLLRTGSGAVVVKPQSRVDRVEVSLAEVEVNRAERSSESNGAVFALTLGLSITGLLLVLVGCRLRMVRRRLRRGRSPYAHDADYLVNGMYL